MQRGYVYLGRQMLAVQEQNQVSWVHQDPVTKSQRLTDSTGAVVSTIELDPWGGEIARSSNQQKQPHRYTSYERDSNGGDEAMMRRYESKWSRISQPDPFNGSYKLSDPQSFNRYSYTQNDPVNFADPTGLERKICGYFDDGTPSYCDEVVHIQTFGDLADRLFFLNSYFGGYHINIGGRPTQDPKRGEDCEATIPIFKPDGASVKDNIKTTVETVNKYYFIAGMTATAPGGPFDRWFEDMVAAGQPWDYKKDSPRDKPRLYEAFGNFNYGATGAAAGYSLGVLQRMAGWVQQHSGPESASVGAGTPSPSKYKARLGWGGTYPFGDEKIDAEFIELGYSYYKCLKENGQ